MSRVGHRDASPRIRDHRLCLIGTKPLRVLDPVTFAFSALVACGTSTGPRRTPDWRHGALESVTETARHQNRTVATLMVSRPLTANSSLPNKHHIEPLEEGARTNRNQELARCGLQRSREPRRRRAMQAAVQLHDASLNDILGVPLPKATAIPTNVGDKDLNSDVRRSRVWKHELRVPIRVSPQSEALRVFVRE